MTLESVVEVSWITAVVEMSVFSHGEQEMSVVGVVLVSGPTILGFRVSMFGVDQGERSGRQISR